MSVFKSKSRGVCKTLILYKFFHYRYIMAHPFFVILPYWIISQELHYARCCFLVKSVDVSFVKKQITVLVQQPMAAVEETFNIIKLATFRDWVHINLHNGFLKASTMSFHVKSCLEHSLPLSYDSDGAVYHKFIFKYYNDPDVKLVEYPTVENIII